MYSKIKSIPENKIIFFINKAFLLTGMLLIRFPVALGFRYNLIVRSIALPLIVSIILINLFYIKKYEIKFLFNKWMLIIFTLFLVFWIQAIIRSMLNDIYPRFLYDLLILVYIVILGFYFLTIFIIFREQSTRAVLIKSMIYGYSIYVLVNLVMHLIGLEPENTLYLTDYPTQMLTFLGLQTRRVLFPMADGINNFGLVSGATLVGLVTILQKNIKGWERLFVVFQILVCLSVIMLADSRGALLFSSIAIAFTFIPKKVFPAFKWIPIAVSVIPFFLFAFTPASLIKYSGFLNRSSSNWNPSVASHTERACVESMQYSGNILSNRTVIWSKVISDLSNFKPVHLIGYGFRGQVVSGISSQYACLFASYMDKIVAGSHNIWLQICLDIGYLGFFVAVFFLAYVMINLQHLLKKDWHSVLALISIVSYTIMIGSLESSLSPDFFEIFILLIFITAIVLVPDNESEKENVSLSVVQTK